MKRLLSVANLEKRYGAVKAVDKVSFAIGRGETLALVGESGCGKSTTGRCILRLEEPTAGRIEFDGLDLLEMRGKLLRAMRGKMQVVFQDPFSSLNPRMRVGHAIGEPLHVHGLGTRAEITARVGELLALVGLRPGDADRLPHEMSGGQRQRVGIARALALEPELIVADEPVSALDVSVQAQIVNLMQDLQEKLGIAYLFISHDLSVVRHIAHRTAVMYLGRIVELGATEQLFADPRHPYTEALLSAVPVPDPERERERIVLTGDLPESHEVPPGCRFHPRCPYVMDRCRTEDPAFRVCGQGHEAACHLVEQGEG